MIQVMVALGILGILVAVFSGLVAQTMQAQKIVRLYGEKQDMRAIFRGALTCETACRDLSRDVPKMVGHWEIRARCPARVPLLEVRHPDLYGGGWSPLYRAGSEQAVCKRVTRLPGLVGRRSAGDRRQICPPGKQVTHVNFLDQSIACR